MNTATFSPDGLSVVTTTNDKVVRIWSVRGDRDRVDLRGHKDWVNSAAFDFTGLLVVTASSDHTTRLWSADGKGASHKLIPNHKGGVNSATFSPDGKLILTASNDHSARVWGVVDKELRRTLEGHSAEVKSATLDRKSTRLNSSHSGESRMPSSA